MELKNCKFCAGTENQIFSMKNSKEFDLNNFNQVSQLIWRTTCHVIKISKFFINCKHTKQIFNRHRIGRQFSIKRNQLNLFFGLLFLAALIAWLSGKTDAAPVTRKRSSNNNDASDKPHWILPCPGVPSTEVIMNLNGQPKKSQNLPQSAPQSPQPADDEMASDQEIMNSIIVTAKHAIRQAEIFRENYVLKTFNVEIWAHHNAWKGSKYMWLRKDMSIPKDLGEVVSKQHLENLELEEEALKIYGYLQRLSVAFEQITNDHKDQDSDFKEEFVTAESHLKSILCELRDIISESKWSMFEDATRDIMGPEYRHMDNLTHQHLRDWLIFRDYMNLVEYIVQVMEYFKSKTV